MWAAGDRITVRPADAAPVHTGGTGWRKEVPIETSAARLHKHTLMLLHNSFQPHGVSNPERKGKKWSVCRAVAERFSRCLKRLLPLLPLTLSLSEEADVGLVGGLWTLKMVDGCEIGAVLLFDSTLGAEIKIGIRGGASGRTSVATEIADSLRQFLVHEGAQRSLRRSNRSSAPRPRSSPLTNAPSRLDGPMRHRDGGRTRGRSRGISIGPCAGVGPGEEYFVPGTARNEYVRHQYNPLDALKE